MGAGVGEGYKGEREWDRDIEGSWSRSIMWGSGDRSSRSIV